MNYLYLSRVFSWFYVRHFVAFFFQTKWEASFDGMLPVALLVKNRCVGWTLSRMGRKYFFWKNFFDRPIVVRCTSSRRECNACQFWAPNWDTNFERVLNVKNLAEANFNKFSWALCTSIVTFSFVRIYKYGGSITLFINFRIFINKVCKVKKFLENGYGQPFF